MTVVSNGDTYAVGFPVSPYESVQIRIATRQSVHPDLYEHFSGGWNAVRNRAIGCHESADRYAALFAEHGVAPTGQLRVAQDNCLFSFFVYALSSVESYFFAVHAVGAILAPNGFPMGTDHEMKKITPELTSKRFKTTYPRSSVSIAMQKILSDPTYKEWKGHRNVLIHRAEPGRHFYWPPRSIPADADWKGRGIVLNLDTLTSRYPWLTQTLEGLLDAADVFTAKQF